MGKDRKYECYMNKCRICGRALFKESLIAVYIIMGVSGCGGTIIGKIPAEKLSVKFYDADNFHPQNNINKMKNFIDY